ncbi:MAG: MmgE/PrpD family protein [Fidelibacterota bacterium]
MTDSVSRTMARFSVGLAYEDLPSEVIHDVKRFLYDSLACAYGALETEDVTIVHQVVTEMGGRPEATAIAFGDRLPAANAAFLNSLMVRALDYNDIYWKQDPSHPSDLIPAALAAGERAGTSMKEVITAIVLAYEFEMRLCEFAVPGIRERKWHHATLTQFVSPLVAGKVLGLTEDQMVNAVGISASHNFTVGAVTAGQLTMMKNTVDPMAVQAGVMAALLAQRGYTGTEPIVEGKEGLVEVLGPGWDTEKLVGGLGSSFKIRECSMKAFPTEALTHTHLSATLKLVRENDIKAEDIEEVRITTIARACDILFDPQKYRPESRETADHSLPFCVARAILDREITPASFSREKIDDPRLKRLIHTIKGEASKDFEELFPEKQPSRVTIRTRDGREFSVYLEYPKGDPREPMTEEDLDLKFQALTRQVLPPERQRKIKELVYGCEDVGDVGEFMRGFAV